MLRLLNQTDPTISTYEVSYRADELLDLEANRQQIGFQIGRLNDDGSYSLDPRAGKIVIDDVE